MEEYRLKIFEKVGKGVEPKNEKVRREWRKFHNKELYDLHSTLNIIRVIRSSVMRWAGHVENIGEMRNAWRALVGKPDGNRPLGRLKYRGEDNIKVYIEEGRLEFCGLVSSG
jgi:hypothetical protein